MTLTSSQIRTVIKQLCIVERTDIEIAGEITDKRWRDFQADPHGTFLKLSDRQQNAVAEIINRRIETSARLAAREFAPSVGATL